MALTFLPGDRKLPDYEGKYYTEGRKARTDRFRSNPGEKIYLFGHTFEGVVDGTLFYCACFPCGYLTKREEAGINAGKTIQA